MIGATIPKLYKSKGKTRFFGNQKILEIMMFLLKEAKKDDSEDQNTTLKLSIKSSGELCGDLKKQLLRKYKVGNLTGLFDESDTEQIDLALIKKSSLRRYFIN